MSLRISATAARITGVTAAVLAPTPSNTTWSRLEPLPTSDDIAPALQAPIADPLWMLARQWQFNEFQGEDAGSPIAAQLKVLGAPMRRLLAADPAVPARELGPGTLPVETQVEAERVLPVHAKLNAQAGLHLVRLLRAAGQGAAADKLRDDFGAAIANPADAVADNAGFVWHQLLDQRSIDAHALATVLRPVAPVDATLDAFIAAQALPGGDALRGPLRAWLAWLDDLVVESGTDGPSPYWNPQRLEYGFGLRTEGAVPELRLAADEYADGRLDWHSYDLAAEPDPAIPTVGQGATEWTPKRAPMPAVARYPGMPADRYWEFEDGQVNFGRLGAAKSDLARLAVMEYALVYGNDWYVLPVTLDNNAVYRVEGFTVRDNFGITVPIPPARNKDGTQWTLFDLSLRPPKPGDPVRRLGDAMYLCPALDSQEGPPLEQVLMMRDEMANMVWGIEKRVQGTSGEALDRGFESHRLTSNQTLTAPSGAVVATGGGAPLKYTLQTPVAPNWIPFLPVKRQKAGALNWSIQLQRGVVVHHYQVTPSRIGQPRFVDYKAFIDRLNALPFVQPEPAQAVSADLSLQAFAFHPRGEILRARPGDDGALFTDYLLLEEEEVPREGIEVKRAFNYARDANGRALLWIGRTKKVGRGEGASGLKFDVVT